MREESKDGPTSTESPFDTHGSFITSIYSLGDAPSGEWCTG